MEANSAALDGDISIDIAQITDPAMTPERQADPKPGFSDRGVAGWCIFFTAMVILCTGFT